MFTLDLFRKEDWLFGIDYLYLPSFSPAGIRMPAFHNIEFGLVFVTFTFQIETE